MISYSKGRLPQVIFGSRKSLELINYLKNNEITTCLIISGHTMSKHPITVNILHALDDTGVVFDLYDRVTPEPTDELCMEIAAQIKQKQYDCVIGIGGGSSIDAAKAASLIAGIPEEITDLHEYGKSGIKMKETWNRPCMLILLPTTSGSGAETTSTAVITSIKYNLKFSFGNRHTSGNLCIIDPEYTLGMPKSPTLFGGTDTLSHIIENLLGTASNDYTEIILLECLKRVWKWLPVAVREPYNLEAREQLSWSAHNALANGGMPNGHAVAHAIGSLYHLVHGHACMIVLPTVIRHFANTSQDTIRKIADIIGVPIIGNAITDAECVASAILEYYKHLGMQPLKSTLLEKGFDDDQQTFVDKMIPAIMDDFKSTQWLPPIHTNNYRKKIEILCTSIYLEQ